MLFLFALFGSACSGRDDTPAADPEPIDTDTAAVDTTPTAAADPPSEPAFDRYGWVGEDVAITMARADRPSGYLQAEIVRLLLTELGYTVNELQNIELAPEYFHGVLGEGEIDLWANGRFPDDEQYWNLELADGSTVADHVTAIGELLPGAGLQGFVTNAVLPLDMSGLTLDLIDGDADARAPFDAADELDGTVQILGCPEDSICADQIDEMIRFARWRNIDQRYGDPEELTEAALRRIVAGKPVIIYLGGPSARLAQLIPGENVVWLSVDPDSVLDGSITAAWNQRIDDEAVAAPVAAASCTADPCYLSWRPTEIRITARTDFLDQHPGAATLLEAITIPPADLYFGLSRQGRGVDVGLIASQWIADNRAMVDEWLADAARAAR